MLKPSWYLCIGFYNVFLHPIKGFSWRPIPAHPRCPGWHDYRIVKFSSSRAFDWYAVLCIMLIDQDFVIHLKSRCNLSIIGTRVFLRFFVRWKENRHRWAEPIQFTNVRLARWLRIVRFLRGWYRCKDQRELKNIFERHMGGQFFFNLRMRAEMHNVLLRKYLFYDCGGFEHSDVFRCDLSDFGVRKSNMTSR